MQFLRDGHEIPQLAGLLGVPEQGAATPIRLATLPDGGPTGSFFEDDGVVPW
ncbi:hypothetical protein GCM10017557_76840 [Streptomyces aurantiacus]|uniref:Uncharacterized protein n=1 Tax=Streptomyces aurantiacus TaxID=47760 RepID=A0A7G1PH61_9ACTN|nr:hypothetical protein GCM10017557_76840 [Streptomyces aurantiacus]